MTSTKKAPTFAQVRKLLPKFAENLAPFACTVIALRDAVTEELEACGRGENPLSETQIEQLQIFLRRTR